MKHFLSAILALALPVVAISDSSSKRTESYIAEYSPVAVSEMYRSGIPASITLAQGILESSSGVSRLATEGRTHFGIKCHAAWKGPVIYADADALHECFRKYSSPDESYRDHSDFLRYKPRYASLFDLNLTDYKGWAYGLKAAGYATDPAYAGKLIGIIETYNLTRFDTVITPEGDSDAQEVLPPSPAAASQPERYTSGSRGTFAVSLAREVLQINGVPFIYSREGETYASIALQYDLFPRELASFNDDKDLSRRFGPSEKVYLSRKSSHAAKGLDKHICSEGETLRDVSQRYAVRVKQLMKYNGIKDQDAPLREDQTILLRND